VVLGPLFFLLILEAGLRVAGIGHPMSFFLPLQIDGKDCFIENDRFGWRFFDPELARTPFPFVIPKVKPADTVRVFVFGESAAYGDPQPEFGLSRILQALLEGRYPEKRFEVVNTAMTAINSHAILPIARDCAGKSGDFWVIYMGNNEVVGPYGSGTVFGPQAPSLSLVRANVAFKATRLGQVFASLVREAQKRSAGQSEWGGLSMFVGHHVRQDDPRMAAVYASFARNLEDIIDTGLKAGAKVLVSTVARNLRDCGPFASEHRPGLTPQELSRWNTLYQNGTQSQETGRTLEAMDCFRQAAQMDDAHAEEHFRWGQCALALGQDTEALRQFNLACDQDALRFRADSRINEAIRGAASKREEEGVRLFNADAAIAQRSPHGLAGGEFLYEHVHLNFEGNYLVALGLADQIGRMLPTSTQRPWPTADDCARRLGWSDYARHEADVEILRRLTESPFKEQADNRPQYQRLLQQIQQLQSATLPEALRAETARAKAAADAVPDDWILQENLAHLQQQTGATAEALASLRRLTSLLPQSPEAWDDLGLALDAAKQDEEAIAVFQRAARLSPESVSSMNSLAELYARQGRNQEAERAFRQVLRRKPHWAPAYLGLGKVLEATGRREEARQEFQEAFENRIRTPKYLNSLAQFSFAKGWYDAAVTNFTDSLLLYPLDPDTHLNLGLALLKMGRHSEAETQFGEAVRLQPDFAQAHFLLGMELGKSGHAAAAAEQFAETVRLKPTSMEARLNLGIALYNQHLPAQALAQFDEVLRHDSGNPVALKYTQILRASSPAPRIP
jgi:tetratricopeptide (TPR) repeat protein